MQKVCMLQQMAISASKSELVV